MALYSVKGIFETAIGIIEKLIVSTFTFLVLDVGFWFCAVTAETLNIKRNEKIIIRMVGNLVSI